MISGEWKGLVYQYGDVQFVEGEPQINFKRTIRRMPDDVEASEEVIEECAAFPHGDHDDLVDSMTQAVMRFRQGGLVAHPEDYKDPKSPKVKRQYYG